MAFSGIFTIQNSDTNNYVLQGDDIGGVVRLGDGDPGVFDVSPINSEGTLYHITDIANKLKLAASPDGNSVIRSDTIVTNWIPEVLPDGLIRIFISSTQFITEVQKSGQLTEARPTSDWKLTPVPK